MLSAQKNEERRTKNQELRPHRHLHKPKPVVVLSFAVLPAAGETSSLAAKRADTAKFLRAAETAIEMAGLHLAAREREGVATLFIVQSEVATGLLPFRAVRGNAPAPGAEVGEQMRELVAQRAIYFLGAEIAQARIEGDERFTGQRSASGAAHTRIPAHEDFGRERVAMVREKKLASAPFEISVVAGSRC